jgi:PAS domain S-box-containing protein
MVKKSNEVKLIKDLTDHFEKTNWLGSLVEDHSLLVCKFRPDFTITYINENFCTLLESFEEKLTGRKLINLVSKADKTHLKKIIKSFSQESEPIRSQIQLTLISGENKLIEWIVIPIKIAKGKVLEFQAIGKDITMQLNTDDKIRLEKLFHESEARYKNLYENSPIGIYRTSPEGKILLANSTIIKMLGYDSFEDIAQRNVEQSGYTEKFSRNDFIKILEQNGEIIGYETAWYTKNKEIIYVRENAKVVKDAVGNIIYYEGTVEDISDKKRAEEALNHRLEQLQFINFLSDKVNKTTNLANIFEEATQGIINNNFADKVSLHLLNEKDGKIKYYSSKTLSENFILFVNSYELWQSDEYNKKSIQIFDIETSPLTKDYKKVFFAESIKALVIIPMKTKDKLIGQITLYFNKPHEFSNDDLKLAETIANQIAFTIERTQNEETIQNNERRFRSLLDRSSDIISIISKEGKVLFDTSSSKEIFGQELLGKNIFPFIHPDDLNRVQNAFLDLIKNKNSIKSSTFRIKHTDGSWRCTESIARNFIDDSTINGIVVNTRDITERMRFENELQESESRYKAIFHNNYAVMIILDPSTGNIVDANNSACKYYGYTKEKITSLNISDINIQQISVINKNIKKSVEQSQNYFNFKHKLADGSLRDVEVYSGPVEFQGKKFLYSIIHDLTEKKLAEKVLAEERQLFIAGPVVVFKWDATPKAVAEYVSPNVTMILGYTPEEFMNDSVNFKQIIHPEDRQRVSDEILAHSNADEIHFEQQYRVKRKDGEYRWFDDFTHIIKDNEGKIANFHGYLIDITASKQAEEVIIKSEQKLRELNMMKDKFFSVIAHDLRSPFQGLLGMANILVEDEEITDDERKIFIQKLYEGLKTQFNFIEDLLAWSRIQRGAIEFNPEPNNLSLLFEEIISFLKNNIEKKNLNLHSEVPENLVLNFDRNMIATIIRNLLSNAIKFTYPDGNIYINVKNLPDAISITVEDTGIGINENDLNKLFRLDTHFSTRGTDGEGGTGFGLILSKDFIERHNGKIHVESVQGKGSIFSLSIPKI